MNGGTFYIQKQNFPTWSTQTTWYGTRMEAGEEMVRYARNNPGTYWRVVAPS